MPKIPPREGLGVTRPTSDAWIAIGSSHARNDDARTDCAVRDVVALS